MTPDSDTIYRRRELTADLSLIGEARDLDLSQVADGGANVNALLYLNGNFYTVVSTTIAPQCGPGGGPDVADSNLMMIRLDEDWGYDPVTDVWTLAACPELELPGPTSVWGWRRRAIQTCGVQLSGCLGQQERFPRLNDVGFSRGSSRPVSEGQGRVACRVAWPIAMRHPPSSNR
ncbi:MAG: hypothetical protein ACE5HA_05305 [Anaerolineae bacterium]